MENYYGLALLLALGLKGILHRLLLEKIKDEDISIHKILMPISYPVYGKLKWLKLVCNLLWFISLFIGLLIVWDMVLTAINGEPSKGRYGPMYRGDRGY